MNTQRKRREIDQIRFKALYDLSKLINNSQQEILDFALEAAVRVTSSEIGYIYFCKENETELYLHSWSKNVMPQCSVESYPDKYLVSDTGLWGEAVRQRKPIITNDYEKSPLKRGYPQGHVPVKRHMNLPVFDNEKIVIIAGVGNKETEYTEEDVRQLNLLMDGMWNILKRKKAEEDLRNSNEQLRLDLAERKRLEKELQQAYKMESMGTLAGGIAHDFNNMLSSIIGYTELSMEDIEIDSPIYENLGHVLSAGFRARELVKQILLFSRQEDTDPEPVQIKPIVKEAVKLIQVSLSSNIKLESNIKGDPLIMANATQIYQVVMNLCTNAAHAMQKGGGTLLIEIENIEIKEEDARNLINFKPGPYVRLTVSDTGCGMDQDLQLKIFDPFFTTKKKGVGTGMGLSVVHGIVTGFGGTINVYSEPGKGSVFRLLFPAIERRTVIDNRPAEPMPKGSEHILIVDDEARIVQMNKMLLKSLGYKTTSSVSSVDALKIFKAQKDKFDMLISDSDMPEMTGLQLAENIMDLKPGIPVILCSGFVSDVYREHARSIGIKAYLTKPVLIRELAKTVRDLLDC